MADMCQVAWVIIGNGAMEYISLEVMQLRVQLQDYTNAPGIMPISDYNGGFEIMPALIGICQDLDRIGMESLYLDHFLF